MAQRNGSKKTDKIEVRLSPETKQAFHETCERQGESASSVIRRLIEDYVKRFHEPVIRRSIEAIRQSPLWIRVGAAAALAAGGMMLAVLPSSAEREPAWAGMFRDDDSNGDGRIALSEVDVRSAADGAAGVASRLSAWRLEQFSERDADRDGIVTRDEFRAHYEQKYDALFASLDDGDGGITMDELLSAPTNTSRAFLAGVAMGQRIREQQVQGAGVGLPADERDLTAARNWSEGGADQPPPFIAARLGEYFAKADRDHNARLSRDEFMLM